MLVLDSVEYVLICLLVFKYTVHQTVDRGGTWHAVVWQCPEVVCQMILSKPAGVSVRVRVRLKCFECVIDGGCVLVCDQPWSGEWQREETQEDRKASCRPAALPGHGVWGLGEQEESRQHEVPPHYFVNSV